MSCFELVAIQYWTLQLWLQHLFVVAQLYCLLCLVSLWGFAFLSISLLCLKCPTCCESGVCACVHACTCPSFISFCIFIDDIHSLLVASPIISSIASLSFNALAHCNSIHLDSSVCSLNDASLRAIVQCGGFIFPFHSVGSRHAQVKISCTCNVLRCVVCVAADCHN